MRLGTSLNRLRMGHLLESYLLVGLAFAVPTWFVLSSYFSVDVPASLIFFGNDGWCDPSSSGLGVHCFGDFNERFMIDPTQPLPWPNNLEMSPIGPFITWSADFFARIVEPKFVLFGIASVYAFALLVPAYFASRGRNFRDAILVFVLIGPLSYPFIISMDRLNNLALVVPFLLLFTFGLIRDKSSLTLFASIACIAVKPQFVLLVLAPLALRRWKLAIKVLVIGTVVDLFLIVTAGLGDFGRVKEYISASLNYGQGLYSIYSDFPPNAALIRAIFFFTQYLDGPAGFIAGKPISLSGLIDKYSPLIQLCILLLVAIGFVLNGRRLSPIWIGISSLIASALLVGDYVAPYYLAISLPIAAIVFGDDHLEQMNPVLTSEHRQLGRGFERMENGLKHLLLIALALSIAPILIPRIPTSLIPTIVADDGRLVSLSVPLASLCWMLLLILVPWSPSIAKWLLKSSKKSSGARVT